MVRDDWRRPPPGDARVAPTAAASRPALGLVADLAAAGHLRLRAGGHALLHCHCHEKALGLAAETERALRAVPGLHVDVLDVGCCGMSGTFGDEAEHYDLSVAMAERVLLPAVRSARGGSVVLATGTSCRAQIVDLARRDAIHPRRLSPRAWRLHRGTACTMREGPRDPHCRRRRAAVAGYGLVSSASTPHAAVSTPISPGAAVVVAVVASLPMYGDRLLR